MPTHTLLVAVRFTCVAALLGLARASGAAADEGMWTFDAPPLGRLERDHGMQATPDWLAHLQRSSVRFNSGGSGSFVSADGLVLTNHHVGASALQKLGDETHDYYRDGFAAASRAAELKCHDLELNVLVSIEDVTGRVQAAVKPDMTAAEAFSARRAAMAAIEKESLAATGLRSDVVTLFQGGAYHLYRAKRFTDVRLVFAPEQAIAFFGGDADNFEFPRYNLDICFFRAYEDGKPARVPHHLAWGRKPVAAGDLVFVSGHPGNTDRAKTVAEIVAMRDRQVPLDLQAINRLESVYAAFCDEGPEERRQASSALFGVQNGRKARSGILAALLDPDVIARKRADETTARAQIEAGLAGRPSPYLRIEEAQAELDRIAVRSRMLEGAAGFNSKFFGNARTILRAASERAKPDGERLREYRDSNRGPLELQLFSAEPLYDGFEIVKLADSLTLLATTLGPDDPLVRAVLAGKPPRTRAAELVGGTTLGTRPPGKDGQAARPDRRREFYDGGAAAVAASDDPMLVLARLVDEESRALRKVAEAAGEVKQQAHAEITRARFAREGKAMYPDATFTLRLAYGVVKGIDGAGPDDCPAITTYAGLFARARSKRDAPPFVLPPRWESQRKELEGDAAFMQTPFNFASTADIIGGNSGSPVVNRAGELVGLIFDGNIHSLRLALVYDDRLSRAVSVDAAGILAALKRVYRADALVAEIEAAREPAKPLPAAAAAAWRPLFDGKALGDWKVSNYGGGDPEIAAGAIRLPMGADLNGITWTGEFAQENYEIELEARRVDGNDFFCGLTFPVGADPCSFIVGGWGGAVVGLSNIDGLDAANNETTLVRAFKTGQWYAVKVRVTPEQIECFLDGERVVNQPRAGHTISIRESVEPSRPLGIATYATVAELRNIRWRPVAGAEQR
jgi:hypothetical protein